MIIKMTADQIEATADFIARLQADPTQHIAYFDEQPNQIADSMNEWTDPTNVLLLTEDDRIIGFIGVDYDTTDIKRAWIHGPIVEDWDAHANLLYQAALEQLIPAEVTSYEVLGDAANVNLARLAEQSGYTGTIGAAALSITRAQAASWPLESAPEITPDQYDAFKPLHETCFPNGHYSGRQIIELLDDTHRIFTFSENDMLLGYIYALVQSENEGYIDFLGVAESARRRGIGKHLIIAATQWLFSFDAVQTVSLTVNDTNHAAIALYKQIGYTHARTLKAFRKFL
jgi:ribosomal protein S18 acetylase RimI-like enzyme